MPQSITPCHVSVNQDAKGWFCEVSTKALEYVVYRGTRRWSNPQAARDDARAFFDRVKTLHPRYVDESDRA